MLIVEIYVEAVGFMYCKEMKQRLMKQNVSYILRILKLIEFLKGLVGGVMFIFSIHGCECISWLCKFLLASYSTFRCHGLAKTVWTSGSANCSRNFNGKCYFIGGRVAFQVMES